MAYARHTHLLALCGAIERGGVKEVDAKAERLVNGRNSLCLVDFLQQATQEWGTQMMHWPR
jgi:hypothetical protein